MAESMPRQLRAGTPLAYIGAGLGLFALVAAMSGPAGMGAFGVVVFKIITSGWPVAAYLGGAIGLGWFAKPLFAGSKDDLLLQSGVGLALMLAVGHVIGQTGLVHGTGAMVAAWAPVVLGLAALAKQAAAWSQVTADASPPPTTATDDVFADPAFATKPQWLIFDRLAMLLAVVIMLVAACSPPGGLGGMEYNGLWASEFGGFDAVSYHLPLVQEWLAGGTLRPVEHSVYSFLPGYVEAAFLHLGVMTGAGGGKQGLLDNDGTGLLTCQMLHAGLGILTGFGASRLAKAWASDLGPSASVAARFASTLALATPWTVVVGSLAYNELGVTALAAPVLLAASDDRLSPWKRGFLAGLLMGAATSVKPPAFFLLGAPVAVLLFASIPAKRWPAVLGAGCAAGLLVMSPWLIRNQIACGNPVFPYASTFFGTAHWTTDMVARYAAAHHESAPILDRIGLAFFKPASGQHRGLFHPQWALFFPIVAVGGVLAIRAAATRTLAARLAAGLGLALVLWLMLTHVQSRFLLPLLVPGAALAALGLASLRIPASGVRTAALLLGLVQAGALTAIYSTQRDGQPGRDLTFMPADAAGESLRASLAKASSGERVQFFTTQASPLLYCNLALPPGSTVYLLGDATPLYYTVPIVYSIVYDRWPLAQAMDEFPGPATQQGGLWIQALRRRGITHVLVNLPEIARYRASGYSDPRLTVDAVLETFLPRAARVRAWGDPTRPSHILFDITAVPTGLARAEARP